MERQDEGQGAVRDLALEVHDLLSDLGVVGTDRDDLLQSMRASLSQEDAKVCGAILCVWIMLLVGM